MILYVPYKHGYEFFRFDRDAGVNRRGGGGLAIYVTKHYTFKYLEEWSICNSDTECMWLRLDWPNSRHTYICNWYRPPGGNLENSLEIIEDRLIDILADRSPDIMIFGDSNVNLINVREPATKKYKNFLSWFKLKQLISTPTRITHSSRTLIDHVIVNRPQMFNIFCTVDPGLSDHCMVFTARKQLKVQHPPVKIWARSYNPVIFRETLESVDWSPVYSCTDVDQAVAIFTDMFVSVIDKFAPYKWLLCKGKSADWITNEFLSLVDTNHFRCRKFNQNPSPENFTLRKLAIREVTRMRPFLQWGLG